MTNGNAKEAVSPISWSEPVTRSETVGFNRSTNGVKNTMPEYHSYNKGGRRDSSAQPPQRKPSNPRPPRRSARRESPNSRGGRNNTISKRRVRKNYVIHAMLAAILLIIVFAVLSVTVLFNVHDIIIEGDSVYSDEEILTAGKIEIGVNLLRFDNEQSQKDIMDKLVRLDTVTVKEVFPSSILVTVQSAERAFCLYYNKTYLEVSREGRIIGSVSKYPGGLVVTGLALEAAQVGGFLDSNTIGGIVINGGNVIENENEDENFLDAEKIDVVFRITDLIDKHELSEISRIDISDRFDIKMFNGEYKKERVEVILGAPTQLDEKLAVVAKIITDEIASSEKGELRVSNPRKASFRPYLVSEE